MPAINWAFLCDYAYVDPGGKPSIIGMFENIRTAQLPSRHPQIFLVMQVMVQGGENVKIGAIISSPSGKEITKISPPPFTAPTGNSPEPKKFVLVLSFYHIEFTETGEHHVEIFIGDNCIHSIPFNLILVKLKPENLK